MEYDYSVIDVKNKELFTLSFSNGSCNGNGCSMGDKSSETQKSQTYFI